MLELIFNRVFRGCNMVYDHNCFDSDSKTFTMEVYGDLPILKVCVFQFELERLGITFIGLLPKF